VHKLTDRIDIAVEEESALSWIGNNVLQEWTHVFILDYVILANLITKNAFSNFCNTMYVPARLKLQVSRNMKCCFDVGPIQVDSRVIFADTRLYFKLKISDIHSCKKNLLTFDLLFESFCVWTESKSCAGCSLVFCSQNRPNNKRSWWSTDRDRRKSWNSEARQSKSEYDPWFKIKNTMFWQAKSLVFNSSYQSHSLVGFLQHVSTVNL
jgi:hypothetical protein